MNREDDEARQAWLAEGNAKQARKRVATKAVIRDIMGRVLLVNPTYKQHWDLPGGMAEANEPPTTALEREILEELNLHITAGRLLLLDWVGPHGPWDDQLIFVFDGGSLTPEHTTLTVSDSEISAFDFVTVPEATRLLRPDNANRLTQALLVAETGQTHYTETTNLTYPE